jgi:hypothetical protein
LRSFPDQIAAFEKDLGVVIPEILATAVPKCSLDRITRYKREVSASKKRGVKGRAQAQCRGAISGICGALIKSTRRGYIGVREQ